MKKITCTFFSFLFLTFASFFILSSVKNEIRYGEGKGTSEKISTISEYKTMLTDLKENIGFSSDTSPEDTEEPTKEKVYNSFTWTEETYFKIDYKDDFLTYSSEIERTLQYCVINEVSYYKVNLRDYFYIKRGNLINSGIYTYEAETFIDDSSVLYRLSKNELNSDNIEESYITLVNEYFRRIDGFNKWYDFSKTEDDFGKKVAESYRNIDFVNDSVSMFFLQFIDKYENIKLIENNNIFKLENDDFKKFMNSFYETIYSVDLNELNEQDNSDYNGNLTIDLSKEKAPVLYTEISSHSDKGSAYSYNKTTLTNLNNTIITKPKKIETTDIFTVFTLFDEEETRHD